jgi:hypothetical protein
MLAGDGLAELPHLGGVGARPCGALLGDLFEPLTRRHAADRRHQIRGRQPEIRHHAEIDRRDAGKARWVEPDRDQPGPGRRALAVAVAEVQQHIDLARIAHVAQLRPDEERMPGRERLRPEAERARLSGDRQAEELGELEHLLAGAAPGELVADAEHRVLRLDEHARRFLDVVLVGADAHRHVEFRLIPDGSLRLLAQRVGRQRQEHRPARRRRGELHATAGGFRNRRRGFRRPVPLGDRLGHDFVVVGFLEQVAAERVLLDRGDGDHDRNLVLPAIDHLGHGVGQTDIRHDDDAGLARGPGIAVGHGDHGAFVNPLDQLDAGFVHHRVEDRVVAGRRVEEDVLDARRLELGHEQRAAGSLHVPHRGGGRRGRLAERRQRLRHRPGRDGAHPQGAQAGHELPARHPMIEILFDQFLHGILLPVAGPIAGISLDGRRISRPK